ncbi:MAG TPA: CBS domain-containing protein [Nitrososphaeraceae archaeon]|jgi:CBS domain-containing protein|nr:CBS domain-containing protein [Nitrososphaeraceae archaeon]
MNALDVMSVDVVAAKENATVIEIATRLVLGAFNGVPIINDSGSVTGIITAIDILRAIRDGKSLDSILVRDLMTPNPSVVKQDTAIEQVIDVMDKKGIEMVPVVEDDGRLIGVISRSDILKEKINERFVTIGREKTVTTTLGEA